MATDSGKDTSRTVVKTYVPAYQREEWDEHADDLDMSRSEFVKAMVQAGRRGFDGTPEPNLDPDSTNHDSETGDSSADTGTNLSMEETVLESLSADTHRDWDELLAAVTDGVETQLEETLQRLQSEDKVRYSGRHGGYTLEQ